MIIVVLMQTKSEDEKNQQHLLYNSNNNILGSIIKKSFFSIHHIPFSSFILRVCMYVCSYVDTIIYMLLLPQNSASLFITLSSYNSLHLFIIQKCYYLFSDRIYTLFEYFSDVMLLNFTKNVFSRSKFTQ